MNFDKLKEQWDNEPNDHIHIPDSLDKLKAAQTPVDAVRRQMRNEFFLQIAALILLAFAPLIFRLEPLMTNVFLFCYAMVLTFTAYYFYKFFTFYKQSYNMTYDSRNNLLWFYYELKLNIELYKALSYITYFIGFSFGVLIVLIHKVSGEGNLDSLAFLDTIAGAFPRLYFVVLLVFSLAFAFSIAEIVPRYYYGKHLKKIKKILDELDELE